jgi:tetratricopeptide (TPR) repeat protein
LKPNRANPYDSYGELLLKMGKYDESIVQYKKANEIDPVNFANSLIGVGNNYIFKGDYQAARKYYQEFFDKSSVNGENINALFLKSISYVHEGDIEKALSTCEEIRALPEKEKLAMTEIGSYIYQGRILTETGNPNKGIQSYEKAVDLIGKSDLPETDKNSLNTYLMMYHFYGLTALGELDKANTESDNCKLKVESRKNHGEELQLNAFLAYFEIKKGEYDKAIQHFSKADTEDPLNWYYTAVAYNKKGDKQSALKLYEEIAKCNINSLNLALVRKRAMEELKK